MLADELQEQLVETRDEKPRRRRLKREREREARGKRETVESRFQREVVLEEA